MQQSRNVAGELTRTQLLKCYKNLRILSDLLFYIEANNREQKFVRVTADKIDRLYSKYSKLYGED